MGAIAPQITSLTIVYSTVYSDTDQRKHQSSATLAFVRGIHRKPVNSPHKWPVTRKMFPFDDVIMNANSPRMQPCPKRSVKPFIHQHIYCAKWYLRWWDLSHPIPCSSDSVSRKPYIPAIPIPPYDRGRDWTGVNIHHHLGQEVLSVIWSDLIHFFHFALYWIPYIFAKDVVTLWGQYHSYVRLDYKGQMSWMYLTICGYMSVCLWKRYTKQTHLLSHKVSGAYPLRLVIYDSDSYMIPWDDVCNKHLWIIL